jgi:hemolysin-activating ACP:hemolysin acyltransferase
LRGNAAAKWKLEDFFYPFLGHDNKTLICMQKRIYLKDWLELKPYEKQVSTDLYYLKICNEVKEAIASTPNSFILHMYLDDSDIDLLSCFLTSYFEDLISETNIWNTFVKVHQRLYKKQIPFYPADEYYEEEINPQDICFLIWYFLNTVQEEKFISPFNTFITETAESIMEVFDQAWEYAPANEYLRSFYQIKAQEDDFYAARQLIDTILFNTYLFYPDTLLKLAEQEIEIIENQKEDEPVLTFLNENRDNTLHKIHTCLLSLTGKEWAAEILGENHPLSGTFLSMSLKIRGLFLYKGQDENQIFLEHIASGKKFNLTKKSFDHAHSLKETDSILFMGIVRWKDEWWFSGVFFQQPYNPDLILDEKNSLENRMPVNFLDHQNKETAKLLENQFAAFKDSNKGLPIAFLPAEKIDDFVQNYTEYFNNTLNLTLEEKQKAGQRARNEGYMGTQEVHKDYAKVSETGLVFFNPKSGVEIALAVNAAFPLPNNPFFRVEESEDAIMTLLMSNELSAELAMYCIDNCKNQLPFFNEAIGKKYLEDIDFLLRFWKKDHYFPIPQITYIGEGNASS